MDILNPIFTEKAACQDCYKCLRECSVKAIKVESGRAAVVPELCVLCGHCVEVCPVGAKKVRDDLARAKHIVSSRERVMVSLAPSFASEFPELSPGQLIAALKRLGFHAVSETARGADLVAGRVAQELSRPADERNEGRRILISSACPTVVEYLKKYRSPLGRSVAGLYSPLLAHAGELKERYGDELAVVFIGPCISKKRESDLHRQLVDAVIDFKDLRRWFKELGVVPERLTPTESDRFVPDRAAKGALYPMDGGMIAAVKRYRVPEGARFMAFSGLAEIDRALAELHENDFEEPVFLELLACAGGCVNGPRGAEAAGTIKKRLSIQAYADGAKDCYTGLAPRLDYAWEFEAVRDSPVSPETLEAMLRRTGKASREDELNCGGCGYDTCRDFARAMIAGKAEQGMCVSYMRCLAQKKANGLIAAMPSGVVIVDKDLRIIECNHNFALLMGEDAERLWEAKPGLEGAELQKLLPFHRYFLEVLLGGPSLDKDLRWGKRIVHAKVFGIEQGAYAGGVLQDVTAPWIRKDRIVSQAKKVISKNLAVVQKIAYLLGENAAETEATLTSIIESFDEEQGKEGGAPKGDEAGL